MPNYVLSTVMGITAYVVCASFVHTYFFSKAKKDWLLVSYIAVAFCMLSWPAAKLLEIVSPAAAIEMFYIRLQYGLALFFITSLIFFVCMLIRKRSQKRIAILLLCTGIPAVCGLIAIYFATLSAVWNAYLLILLFSVLTLILLYFKNSIFPEIEISLDDMIENGEDRVAVFDLNGNLVDMNLRSLGEALIPSDCMTLDSFLQTINRYSKQGVLDINEIGSLVDHPYENEICIELDNIITYYIFTADTIKNKKDEKLGTVCTFRDITENKLIAIELDKKNRELQRLNKELGAYIRIADSLAEEKERARIAREINNTIGQKLTEILLVLEVIKLTNHHDAEIFEGPLNEVIDSCRQVLGEIRVVVSRLIPEKNKGGKQFGQNSDCR